MGVQQRGGGPVFLNGCTPSASFFLTGDTRQYDTKDGAFASRGYGDLRCRSAKG